MLTKRLFLIGAFVCFILEACDDSGSNTTLVDEINNFDAIQSFSEITEDPYMLRVGSVKEEYKVGEEVELFGELHYLGNKVIKLMSGDSVIQFHIEEKTQNVQVVNIVRDIAVYRDLKKNRPIRESYQKELIHIEGVDEDYNRFMEEFMNEKGFPPGYYIVKGVAEFVVILDGESEIVRLETEIDFKVVPD